MRPRLRPLDKEQIKKNIGKIWSGASNYGKNVAGGAKILGGALKNLAKWPGNQIEKEWRGEDEAIEEFRRKHGDRSL